MNTQKIRVAVNGYGVIGKRIADAVVAQDDMELIGVADTVSDWRIKVAVQKRYPIFTSTVQVGEEMKTTDIPLEGSLDDLLRYTAFLSRAAKCVLSLNPTNKSNTGQSSGSFLGQFK